MDHTGGYITGPAPAGLVGLPALEGKMRHSLILTDLSRPAHSSIMTGLSV